MAEYIEREKAIELLSEPITMSMCLSMDECHHKIAQRRIDLYLIENIPAADVRPVVVCTDCEHNNHCLTQEFVDDCGKIPLDRNTFFCADGEKREES
jgi:hypothetical protein